MIATVAEQESVDFLKRALGPVGWEIGKHVGESEEQRRAHPLNLGWTVEWRPRICVCAFMPPLSPPRRLHPWPVAKGRLRSYALGSCGFRRHGDGFGCRLADRAGSRERVTATRPFLFRRTWVPTRKVHEIQDRRATDRQGTLPRIAVSHSRFVQACLRRRRIRICGDAKPRSSSRA